jgi:hypothetical protein
MATEKDIQNQKNQNEELQETVNLTNELAGSAARAQNAIKGFGDKIKDAKEGSEDLSANFDNAQSEANKLATAIGKLGTFEKSQLKDAKERKNITKNLAAIAKQRLRVEAQISANNVMMANATEAEKEAYSKINEELLNTLDTSDGILSKFDGIADKIKEIDKGSSFANKLADGVKDIPGLGPLLAGPIKDFAKGLDAVNSNFGEAVTSAEDMSKLTGGLMKSAFIFIAKSAFAADKSTTNMAKQLGISKDEAQGISTRFNNIALSSDKVSINAESLKKSFSELGNELGAVVGFTDEQIEMQTTLTKLVGLEAGQSAKLVKYAIGKEKPVRKITTEILDQVKALEKETGIRLDGRKVLAEVSEINGNLAASYKFNTAELGRAVTQANKLGLSLKDTANISRNLLDFEESLTAEMSAELMIGRDLELSRARSLALDGKSAEAVAELAKNFGSAEEFSQLNVLAREDLAKAMGMEVDQLADAIKKEEVLRSLGVANLDQLAKEGRLQELNGSEQGEILLQQYEQQSAAEKFAETMAKLQASVGEIANNFMPVIDMLATASSSSTALKGILVAIGAISFAGTLAKLGVMLAGLSANAAAAMATASAITLGFGIAAVVVGIAAGMAAVSKAKNEAKADKSIKDGIIGPGGEVMVSGPKGSVNIDSADSMLVGTDLGGGGGSQESRKTNQLLERILMKQGTVEMDGNKVGTAFAVGSYSLQ